MLDMVRHTERIKAELEAARATESRHLRRIATVYQHFADQVRLP
jgi:hypothetical protein